LPAHPLEVAASESCVDGRPASRLLSSKQSYGTWADRRMLHRTRLCDFSQSRTLRHVRVARDPAI